MQDQNPNQKEYIKQMNKNQKQFKQEFRKIINTDNKEKHKLLD